MDLEMRLISKCNAYQSVKSQALLREGVVLLFVHKSNFETVNFAIIFVSMNEHTI